MASGLLEPTQKSMLATMEMMYGDEVEVGEDASPPGDNALCALYLLDDDTPVAAALCDPAFGAFAGASLSMIPPGGAQDAADSGELSAGMLENLHEVMNICCNLFMNDSTPHIRLGSLYPTLNDLPDNVKEMITGAGGPAFSVEIPRYGTGVVRFVS